MTTTTSMLPSVAERFPRDYQEHTYTRHQNDRELSARLAQLSNAQDLESLERFAKAYLGMYLDMDNSIPANDRIDMLAHPALAEAIRQGFKHSLEIGTFPTPGQIAKSMQETHYPLGYILLAALDMYREQVNYTCLAEHTVIAAVCFHYAYKTEIDDDWLSQVLQQRSGAVSQAIGPFWQQLIEDGTDHLPGLYSLLNRSEYADILHDVLLPILRNWHSADKKSLRSLLYNAFAFCDHQPLLDLVHEKICNTTGYEPARYILWLNSGYLLDPARYELTLLDYCGRSKEKIIPLMDFSCQVLANTAPQALTVSAQTICTLLRIIAPKITPQEDRYGALCENSRKLLYLFYRLAISPSEDREQQRDRLLKVRVMKLYSPILCYSPEPSISLQDYIDCLLQQGLIRRRIKRYD